MNPPTFERPNPDLSGNRNWDHDAFVDCVGRAGKVRGGYWSPFAALAWVVSKSENFVASVQLFEGERHADRGGAFSSSVWWTIGNEAGERFGVTLTDACDPFREALEDGRIEGGIATNIATGELIEMKTSDWTEWNVAHDHDGMRLLPGFVNFKWPAASIKAAFPVNRTATDVHTTPVARWQQQRASVEQQELFRFFGLAKAHLPSGSHFQSRTDLHRRYAEEWLPKQRGSGKCLRRTAFNKQLDRYLDGWRIEGTRWRLSQ